MNKHQRKKFIKLYEPIHQQLDSFCRFIAGNKENGADLMHDTVLSTMENFDKLKNERALKAYMFSTASNLNKKNFRKKRPVIGFDAEEMNCFIDQGITPEVIVDFRIIYEKLLNLPGKMSEAMILFHISDMSLEDIRKIQGGSLSGVKLRLKRGREKLFRVLNDSQQTITMLWLLPL